MEMHKRVFRVCAPVLLICAVGNAHAASVLIDFETFPDSSPVSAGTEITNQYASLGVIFSSTNTSSGATLMTNIHDFVSTTSPSNFLAPGGPAPNNGGTLLLDFTTLVAEVGSFFIGDQFSVEVTAYDQNNAVVGMAASDGSRLPFDSWQIDYAAGISRVEMVGGFFGPDIPDGWGIDDLSYVQVPEPTTLALAAIGLMRVACCRRRAGRPLAVSRVPQ